MPSQQWVRKGPAAMTRAWCIVEVARALSIKGCTLHVVLSPADLDDFEGLLAERFDEIAGTIAVMDARDAQISNVEDREYLLTQANGSTRSPPYSHLSLTFVGRCGCRWRVTMAGSAR